LSKLKVLSLFCGCSCYYTSRNCKYFFDGECYENTTSLYNASACLSALSGYFLKGRCYYNAPRNCSSDYYHHCVCYPQRSANFSNETCININGFPHTDDYCYYVEFNCPMYPFNGQCYRRVNRPTLCIKIYIFDI